MTIVGYVPQVTPEMVTTVAKCMLLSNLSEDERSLVLSQGRQWQAAAGEYFFHQGEESERLFVIVSGTVKLTQVTVDGEQVIVNYFGPGDGLGVIVALSDMPYPLSAEAVEECSAICWSREAMRALMFEYPQLALNGIAMIGGRFAHLQRRLQEMATQRVEQRVALALLRLVRQFGKRTAEGVLIDMPLTREELAQMTGTNLYNVSRILSRWEQLGYINSKRRYITLLKSHELVVIGEDLRKPDR